VTGDAECHNNGLESSASGGSTPLSPSWRLLLFTFVLLTCSGSGVVTQFPMPLGHQQLEMKSEIHELISKYCRLDYEGARLDAASWPKIEPLVWWKSNPDYTRIDVISLYAVDTEPSSSHGRYTVTVQYQLLGSYDFTAGYSRQAPGSVEDVNYIVRETNGEWRISDADNYFPHPSRPAMLKWLSDKIGTAQDEIAKTLYQDALHKLQAQPTTPFAK